MRRFSAAASLLLLALVAVGAAEASLLAVLLLFSYILKLRFGVELGPAGFLFAQPNCCEPQVTLFNGSVGVSFLFSAVCGAGAAAWKFRRWRPPE
jgi:hypothetical protein